MPLLFLTPLWTFLLIDGRFIIIVTCLNIIKSNDRLNDNLNYKIHLWMYLPNAPCIGSEIVSINEYSGTSISQNSREIQFFRLIEDFELPRFKKKTIRLKEFLKYM